MFKVVKDGSIRLKAANYLRCVRQERSLATKSEVPNSADVVVIGGGIAGCNTIYQLTKRGVNAVLLERAKFTSGTTWHTAGLVWSLRPCDLEVKLLQDSRSVYQSLEEESGDYAGWVNDGGMFLSRSKVRTEEYLRLHTLGKALGIPSEVLNPKEAQKKFPLLDPSVFEMALFSPMDGTIDPTMVCNALIKVATRHGAKVYDDCPVVDVHYAHNTLGNKEVTGVHTDRGFIKTKCVVNCGGVWGPRIARYAGVPSLPIVPFKHAYVVMDGTPEIRNCPNIRDHDVNLYIKVQGESCHVGGYEPNPIMLDQVPDNLAFHLYELDWDVFSVHMNSAAALCPKLANVGVKSTVCGPESFTPDHKPLLGEDPNVFAGLGCILSSYGQCCLPESKASDTTIARFGLREAALSLKKVPGVKNTVCGPESFTPCHKPLLGEDHNVNGLYHNCGYNSAGMMFSAGCGIQMAEWLISGRPHYNMFTFDIRRFTPGQLARPHWTRESSHEAYVKNYSIVFPNDEPLAGRDASHDALHQELVEDGAVMQARAGWERPAFFMPGEKIRVQHYDWGGTHDYPRNLDQRYEEVLKGEYSFGFSKHHDLIGSEALACRNAAALFNMSYYGKLYLTGPDAQRTAELAFTADLSKKNDRVAYSLLLNKNGGVEADVTVSVLDGGSGQLHEPIFKGRGYYVVTSGFSANHTLAHLRRIINEYKLRAQITDVTKQLCILSVQGPDSQRILQRYTDAGLSNDAFPVNTHRSLHISQAPYAPENNKYRCRALRVSWSGELGWELHIPSSHAIQVYKHLSRAQGLRNAGWRALTSLSAEKGYHLWNADLRTDDNPIEANLGFACRKDGNYIGNEQVARARHDGVLKKYAYFTLEDQVALFGQEAIFRNGVPVGYLRRGDYAHYLNKPIGVGYVTNKTEITKGFLQNGEYEIEAFGMKHKATLHLRSPFDPTGQRMLGNYGHGLDENLNEPHVGQNERAGGSE